MGGSSSPPTTTSTVTNQTQLSPEQQKLLGLVTPVAANALSPQGLAPYGGSTVAPQPQDRATAQGLATGAAQGIAPYIGDLLNSWKFTQGAALSPSTNPALQDTINASVRPLLENYQQSVMPAINQGGVADGQSGSSRQGVAQGIATQTLMHQIGDTSASVANQGYQAGLDALVKGMALGPQTLGTALLPSNIYDSVGAQQQQQNQSTLDAQQQQFYTNKFLPLQIAGNVAGMAFGMPGGGGSSTAVGPSGANQPSSGLSLLGGASTGAALGTAIGGIGSGAALGTAAAPGIGTAIGAGLGALISLF